MRYETDILPSRCDQRSEILRRRAADGWRLVAVDQGIAYWEAPCAST